MSLTYHNPGAEAIPRTGEHAILHGEEIQWLRMSPKTIVRQSVEMGCDLLHERLCVRGIAHVCRINDGTGRIEQIWVMDVTATRGEEPTG